MPSYRKKAYILLILVTFIWGAAGPVIKFTLNGIDPLPFLAYRFAIAAIFSSLFFLVKIVKRKKFRYFRENFSFAFFYGLLAVPISLGLLFLALDKSSVLDLALVGLLGPMAVTAGGAIFYRDHITHREKIGIAILLTGVVFNLFVPILTTDIGTKITGNILLALFLLADSGSVLIAKMAVRKKIKSSNLSNFAFLIGALVIIPLALIKYEPSKLIFTVASLPLKYHLGVWYMALISGNLAYFLFVRAQRSIEISEAILFHYLQPVFMIPLAVFWLDEKITPHFLVGAAIIAIGLIIAELKRKPKPQRPMHAKMSE